jgi:hypothetical protein
MNFGDEVNIWPGVLLAVGMIGVAVWLVLYEVINSKRRR